jgi:putative transposase
MSQKQLLGEVITTLGDEPRSRAPATFTVEQIVAIVAVACEVPEGSGRPISHWTPRELADEVIRRGIVSSISPRSVRRFLKRSQFTTPS